MNQHSAQTRISMPRPALQHCLRLMQTTLLRSWRGIVWLLTVISFLSLLAGAISHQHHSTLEDRACAVCSTVSAHLPDISAAPGLVTSTALVLAYLLLSAPAVASFSGRRCLPPPSCGPPLPI